MAVVFYAETILTEDVDILVLMPPTDSPVIILTPLYDFFRDRGYQVRGLRVDFEG
ncbi:MAG: hypothetical protein QW795_07290 [Candidatus Bathyarchaeia archaeon]